MISQTPATPKKIRNNSLFVMPGADALNSASAFDGKILLAILSV